MLTLTTWYLSASGTEHFHTDSESTGSWLWKLFIERKPPHVWNWLWRRCWDRNNVKPPKSGRSVANVFGLIPRCLRYLGTNVHSGSWTDSNLVFNKVHINVCQDKCLGMMFYIKKLKDWLYNVLQNHTFLAIIDRRNSGSERERRLWPYSTCGQILTWWH